LTSIFDDHRAAKPHIGWFAPKPALSCPAEPNAESPHLYPTSEKAVFLNQAPQEKAPKARLFTAPSALCPILFSEQLIPSRF
jgi:hypothetical protein